MSGGFPKQFQIVQWFSNQVYGVFDCPACAGVHDACLHRGAPQSLLHQGLMSPHLWSDNATQRGVNYLSFSAHRRVATFFPDQHDDQHLHPHPGRLPQEERAGVWEDPRGGQAYHSQGWGGLHAWRGDDRDENWSAPDSMKFIFMISVNVSDSYLASLLFCWSINFPKKSYTGDP